MGSRGRDGLGDLTSGELGCSVLLLSDLLHQLQVVIAGLLVVHHWEGVILTWYDRDLAGLSKDVSLGLQQSEFFMEQSMEGMEDIICPSLKQTSKKNRFF